MIRYRRNQLTRIINRLYPIMVIAGIFTIHTTYVNLRQQPLDYRMEGHNKNHYVGNTSEFKAGDWKSIVWYELWHGGLRMNAKAVDMNQCEYKKCMINFIDNAQQHRDYFPTADAVIFQGGRLPGKPPQRTHPNQVYIFSSVESPIHLVFNYGGKPWLHAINWTMTYRTDSDILYKYGSFTLKNQTQPSEQELAESFHKKTKDVAWLVSDCKTESRRENYIQQLQKYIKVDVYGKCGSFKNCTKEEGTKCLETIANDYKFYLSFENSMCKDYMTEKVFVWFKKNIITVVRGAMNYNNLLPTHTYIDAHRFKSIHQLGNFMKHLAQDKKEYMKYLHEKDRYETESLRSQFQKAYCELCKRLHHVDNYRKVYPNVNDWWFHNSCKRQITDIH